MACTSGIAKNIVSDCTTQPVAGVEAKAWIMNRLEATFTYDPTNPSKITDIAIAVGKKAYTVLGVKKLLNPGSSLIVAPDRANRYQHRFNFQGFEFTAPDIENIAALEDLVVVVEMIDKVTGGDGTFRAFGVKNGLYQAASEWTANDIDGALPVELASEEGAGEAYPWYTVNAGAYATTLQMLVDLEAVQV